MLTIRLYKKFKRDYKRLQKRGYDISLLDESGSASIKPVYRCWLKARRYPQSIAITRLSATMLAAASAT